MAEVNRATEPNQAALVREAEIARENLGDPAGAPLRRVMQGVSDLLDGTVPVTDEIRAQLAQVVNGYAERVIAITRAVDVTTEAYSDTRGDDKQHAAARFELPISVEQNASVLLKELLGDNADVLIADWGTRADFNVTAPSENQAIFFKDSNRKARNRDFAPADAETTQEEDFENARAVHASKGFQFADDVQATLICAALVKKAENAGLALADSADSWDRSDFVDTGKLRGEEFDLLVKLRDGVVRTRSGALVVYDDGRLRAVNYSVSADANYWAFGCVVSSAESKT